MLARIRKAAENKDSGFTLIELLVVMIIIGILAAIAIPAFLSQKNKAKSTAAKADVSSIGKEVSSYYVDAADESAGGTIAGDTNAWEVTDAGSTTIFATTPLGGKLSAGNIAEGTIASANAWCVTVWNADVDTAAGPASGDGNSAWKYSAKGGLAKGVCQAADAT